MKRKYSLAQPMLDVLENGWQLASTNRQHRSEDTVATGDQALESMGHGLSAKQQDVGRDERELKAHISLDQRGKQGHQRGDERQAVEALLPASHLAGEEPEIAF